MDMEAVNRKISITIENLEEDTNNENEKEQEDDTCAATDISIQQVDGSIHQPITFTNSQVLDNKSEALQHFVFIEPDEGSPAAEALRANATIKVSRVSKGIKKLRNGICGAPKMKSLNIVRQIKKIVKKRANHRFERNFKGKVIDGVHELYTLTAGMMLGIRVVVGHAEPIHSPMAMKLTVSDFVYNDKLVFPPKGSNTPPHFTPPHPLNHTFKFKSYAPKVFGMIRQLFEVDVASYMLSVCGKLTFI